jgi:hypothetical protein
MGDKELDLVESEQTTPSWRGGRTMRPSFMTQGGRQIPRMGIAMRAHSKGPEILKSTSFTRPWDF